MRKFKCFISVTLVWLVFSGITLGKGLGLEKWSDPTALFEANVFAGRYSVDCDDLGTSFLSIDGHDASKLELTYRLFADGAVQEQMVIVANKNIDHPHIFLDNQGNRHLFWLEHGSKTNALCYVQIPALQREYEQKILWETENAIQDLNAIQRGDVTYLVWSERDPYFQIRYAEVQDGVLTKTELVTASTSASVGPTIALDKLGTTHLAWYEASDGKVQIQYSKRQVSGWSEPTIVDQGSLKDIEESETIALQPADSKVYAAWATSPQSTSTFSVNLAEIRSVLIGEPMTLVRGLRPRFLKQNNQLQLVWEGEGPFGPEIHYGIYERKDLVDSLNLTVGKRTGKYPLIIDKSGYTYVYWLEKDKEGTSLIYEINTQFPRTMTFWDHIGIDKLNPLGHLLFVTGQTVVLTPLMLLTDLFAVVVAAIIFFILNRYRIFRKQPLLYQILLIATLIIILRHIPIPLARTTFLDLSHYCLTIILATLGTFITLKPLRHNSLRKLAIVILWAFLFQFFALLPHHILV